MDSWLASLRGESLARVNRARLPILRHIYIYTTLFQPAACSDSIFHSTVVCFLRTLSMLHRSATSVTSENIA